MATMQQMHVHSSTTVKQQYIPSIRPCRSQQRHPASLTLTCASAVQPGSLSTATIDDVFQAAQGQQFGAVSSQQQKEALYHLIEQLKESSKESQAAAAPTEGPLQGNWRLLWTSEASVHSIVRGQLLGVPVNDIQQHIDLQSKRVTNTIFFGWLGLQLQASGPLTVLNSSRIYYSFDKLLLSLLGLTLALPVFFKGGGWTDCVVLLGDDGQKLRVMENSRRDTLVLQKVAH